MSPAFTGGGTRAAAFPENGTGAGLDDNGGRGVSDHQAVESDGHSTSDADNVNISSGMRIRIGANRRRSVNTEDAGGEGMDSLTSD
jgi:hypothetical protein